MLANGNCSWYSTTTPALIVIALCCHVIIGVNGQLQFRDSPHNATSLLSHRTVLTCSVPDIPPANIRWTVDGVVITTSDRVNISYNPATGESQLIIDQLQYTDNGAYRCTALIGNVMILSSIGYVTAIGPPVFRTPLTPMSVSIGGEAIFRCDVYSNPVLQSVSWMFGGVAIVSEGLHITATNSSLTINSVQREDEGSYTCVVTNAYGSQQSSAILSIENVPDLTIATRPSGTLSIVEGNTDSVICTIQSGTPSTLDWYMNGIKLTENVNIGLSHISPTSIVLTLRNVTSSDAGNYMCIATLAEHSVSATIVVDVLTQPRFTNQPGNFTFNTDDLIQITCSATGNPLPTIIFYGPDGEPSQGSPGSNEFSDTASLYTAGQYSCEATNSVGQSVTTFYIFVRGSPMISPLAARIDIGVGSDLSIPCITQGYPIPSVKWTRLSGGLDLSPNSYVINNALTFNGITFANEGTYQCTATNNCDRVCGTANVNTTIFVHEPPVVSTAAEDKYTVTGDTVTLQCAFSSTLPVNITWSKGDLQSLQITAITVNDRITISSSNNSGELIIRSATSDDNGLYTCAGMTIAGTAITAAEILVGRSPVFITRPQDADLNIGEDIILTCSASGDPEPHITWEKTDLRTGERTMLSGSDTVALRNGDLPLVSVQQDDAGLYHCIADNRVDQIEATAVVRVQGPPVVRSITPTIIVAGDNAVLTCNLIFNFPSSSIQWSRSDGLSTVAGRMNVIQNGSLIIIPANVSDAVVYTCQATNQFGSSSYREAVTVHFQPVITLEIFNYTHFIDETAILPCPVDSNPNATFQWRVGMNMAEMQGSKYQVDPTDGTLIITQLRISDSNTYHCIATNYLSSDIATTTIIVEGPPPENITVNTSSSTSLLVEWNPSSVTQTDLIGYQVMFREELGGELANTTVLDQPNIQNRSITLYGLKPFTEYRITVQGIYSVIVGVSFTNGINATITATTAEDFPTATPQRIRTDSDVEYVDIFFEALPEESRNGIIIGYNIYYRPSPPAQYINFTGGVYLDHNGTNFTIANFSLAVYRPGNIDTSSYHYTLDGLDDDSSYDFFMEAFNSVGVGPNTTVYTVQTDEAFPTTLVVVITSTVGGLIIITLVVVFICCCVLYCRRRKKSHEAEADRRTARNVKKLIISEPTTDIPPDTTTSNKFSVESSDGEVIPLNPKVIKPEDRAPSPEPGETAMPVKHITFEDDQQSDRPVSGIYSEPADSLARYNSETAIAKSTEEEIQVVDEIQAVDDAFKEITDKEPLYASIPESHKKAKKEKKKQKIKKKSNQRPTISTDTTLENIDTSTLEGQQIHRMLDAASAGMF